MVVDEKIQSIVDLEPHSPRMAAAIQRIKDSRERLRLSKERCAVLKAELERLDESEGIDEPDGLGRDRE